MLDVATAAENPRAVMGGNLPPEPTLPEKLGVQHAATMAEVDALAVKANALPKTIKDEVQLGKLGDVVKAARGLTKKLDDARKTAVEPHLAAQRETNAFFAVSTDRLKRISDALNDRATDYQREVEAEKRRKAEDEARKLRAEEDRAREAAQAAHEAGKAAAVSRHEDKADLAAERAQRFERDAAASAADLTRTRSSGGTLATSRTAWAFEITDISKVPLEMLRPHLPRADIKKAIRAFVRINQDGVQLGGVRVFQESKAAFR